MIYNININGMTCGFCSKMIEELINGLDGVENVKVSLEQGKANFKIVDGNSVTVEQILKMINNLREFKAELA